MSLPRGSAMEKLHLPSPQLTEVALERRWHNARNTRSCPLVPSPGGAQPTSGRVRRGRRSCRSSPISMEEGPSPCPCPSLTSRARLEFWCFRGLTSQQVQKLRSGRCPAQHTLCNIRADGQCLKVSLLEKRQIKGSRNHRTN